MPAVPGIMAREDTFIRLEHMHAEEAQQHAIAFKKVDHRIHRTDVRTQAAYDHLDE